MESGSPPDTLLQAILRGEVRAAARMITRIEAEDEALTPLLSALYALGRETPVVGITGPPGAGKSSLVDQLLLAFRKRGERVAVLAVDPSSPFSGGAILGDRVRMNRHSNDVDVFIRSMAARGRLGGLSGATGDALIVLDAMGFNRILIETVGVGQSEVEILRHAHTIAVVQTPASGDMVQAVKAGLLEIGDVFVVNKADVPGADRSVSALREVIDFRSDLGHEVWIPRLLKTQATNGEGIEEFVAALDAHQLHLKSHPRASEERRRSRVRALLLERMAEALRTRHARPGADQDRFERAVDDLLARLYDPGTAATRLINGAE